jgi:hypothetical protein
LLEQLEVVAQPMAQVAELAVAAFEQAHETPRIVVVDRNHQTVQDGCHLLTVMLHGQHELLKRHDVMVALIAPAGIPPTRRLPGDPLGGAGPDRRGAGDARRVLQ